MLYKKVIEGVANEESWDLFDGIGIETRSSFDGALDMCIIQTEEIKQLIGKRVRITIEEISVAEHQLSRGAITIRRRGKF